MTQIKELDFSGRSIFCGIDIHKKSWSVCLRDEERELKTFSQNPDKELLADHLKKYYPNASVYMTYEAGFCGFWPYQFFTSQGFDCLVANPSEIPRPDYNRRQKTDAGDCRNLASNLSKKILKPIHIPLQSTIESRMLVRTRAQLVKDQTRYKNRIISQLDFLGIRIPEGYKSCSHFSHRFIVWLKELELGPESKQALEAKLNVLQSIREELLSTHKRLKDLATQEPYKQSLDLLRTIPGIGLISAFILITELEDIKRFKNFDHLAGYAGLKPDIHSSSETMIVKGITHHCNRFIRETLVECTWMAITKDMALNQAYYEYKKRMHYNKAILRVAKKLLNRIRFVLLNNQPYQTELVSKEK